MFLKHGADQLENPPGALKIFWRLTFQTHMVTLIDEADFCYPAWKDFITLYENFEINLVCFFTPSYAKHLYMALNSV